MAFFLQPLAPTLLALVVVYGTSYKRVNVLCPSYWYRYRRATRYGQVCYALLKGVLHATDRHAKCTDTGIVLAILSDQSRSKMVKIHLVRRFRTSVSSEIDADHNEKKLQFR